MATAHSKDLLDDTLSKLTERGRSLHTQYIMPFVHSLVARLLKCCLIWRPGRDNPVFSCELQAAAAVLALGIPRASLTGAVLRCCAFEIGRQGGGSRRSLSESNKRVPNTNTFFFGEVVLPLLPVCAKISVLFCLGQGWLASSQSFNHIRSPTMIAPTTGRSSQSQLTMVFKGRYKETYFRFIHRYLAT